MTIPRGQRDQARALVEQLWESRDGCLSVQVLQEFFVNVAGKIAKPLDAGTAKEIVAAFSRWYLHVPGRTMYWPRSASISAPGSRSGMR